jgi:hypothetical protein
MKKLLLFTLIISNSYANTLESVYLKDTRLHDELLSPVLEQVLAKYTCIDDLKLKEVSTSRTLRGDYEDLDLVYNTKFLFLSNEIIVKSAKYPVSNPRALDSERREVLEISSSTFSCI